MLDIKRYFDLSGEVVTSGLSSILSKRMAPISDWSNMTSTDHFVQFYEAEDHIINAVAEYVTYGIKVGETCIVAATADHIARIEKTVVHFGEDIEDALEAGKYIPLRADEVLAKIIVGSEVDANAFLTLVRGLLEKSSKNGGRTRIFGELVAVLLAGGNGKAAVALEGLWNDLKKEYPFELFCAYPLENFANAEAAEYMLLVCDSHSQVIPSESYTELATANERLRSIALLQQRAKQLEVRQT